MILQAWRPDRRRNTGGPGCEPTKMRNMKFHETGESTLMVGNYLDGWQRHSFALRLDMSQLQSVYPYVGESPGKTMQNLSFIDWPFALQNFESAYYNSSSLMMEAGEKENNYI